MSGKADKVVSKLQKVNRANEELVSCLIEDPTCLDDIKYRNAKKEVYKYAIAYFESKYIESTSYYNKKMPNSRISILLHVSIDDWKASSGEAEDKAATKMTRQVFDASIEELRLVPDDIRATAFKIIRNFLTEKSQ